MGRKRKNDSTIEILLTLPWWVSAMLGILSYLGLAWVIPAVFATNPLLVGLAVLSKSLAWLPPVVFGVIALAAYLKAKAKETAKLSSFTSVQAVPQWDQGARSEPFIVENPIEPVTAWDISTLRALEWKRFELLCARYYDAAGFRTITQPCGGDGGIDIKLFKHDENDPIAIVQCKAWNTYSVGVKEIRELLGVMAHEKVRRGIFITTATFTKEARTFCEANPIQLLDGAAFLAKIQSLTSEHQQSLLTYALNGDYRTPTCPSCGIKMVKRESKRGPFWGCTSYPRCKSAIAISKSSPRPATV